MNETSKIHVFEKAGLGKAPYRFIGVESKTYQACPNAPIQPGGSCQYCSTGIYDRYYLRSADGHEFYVGSDCIYKAGDAGLCRQIEPAVKAHRQAVKQARDTTILNTFRSYLEAHPTYWQDGRPEFSEPHPNAYYAGLGRTKGDYYRFCYNGYVVSAACWHLKALGLLPCSRGKQR